ncbi:hypothetical protein FKM82_021145 [Ascaphus truei]
MCINGSSATVTMRGAHFNMNRFDIAGDDLMRCVDLYNQAQSKWFEEMVTTTLELERLEVERVEIIRQHLCQYTQLRHETDMFNQSVRTIMAFIYLLKLRLLNVISLA